MYLSNSELEHIHKYPIMLTSKQNLQPNKHAHYSFLPAKWESFQLTVGINLSGGLGTL